MNRLLRPARLLPMASVLMLVGCTLVVQDTRSVAAPLTQAAIAACPRSQPNLTTSPDEYFIPLGNGYGNADGTLFTQLWPENKVILSPGGSGAIADDGTLSMKWPWYRTVPGEIVIGGRRLDAPAPPMPEIVLRGPADGYGETGFHPSTLIFPGEGCWEVTGRVGDARLTFVALVVHSPVDMPWPGWLPEGLMLQDTDLSALPDVIGLVFRPDGAPGELRTAVSQSAWPDSDAYPQAAQQPVTLAGQPAVCIQGDWDDQRQWRADADAGLIEWSAGAYSYRIVQTDLGLSCADLVRVASSLS
jgi:hypothetical protein